MKKLLVLLLVLSFTNAIAEELKCKLDQWHSGAEVINLERVARKSGKKIGQEAVNKGIKFSNYKDAKNFCIREASKLNFECEHARFFIKFCTKKFDL